MNQNAAIKFEDKVKETLSISKEALQLLSASGMSSEIKKNTIILSEGEICNKVWYIQSGSCRAYANSDGKDINLHFAFEGEFITILKSLRSNTPSAHYIQTLEDSLIIAFEKDKLFSLYEKSSDVAAFGRALLEKLLEQQEEHAHIFKLQNATERYSYIVKTYPKLIQRISLSLLSSYLGISRETLSRIRSQK